jgi:hypothetical protein
VPRRHAVDRREARLIRGTVPPARLVVPVVARAGPARRLGG